MPVPDRKRSFLGKEGKNCVGSFFKKKAACRDGLLLLGFLQE